MRCLPLLIALLSTTAYAQATATATPLGPPQIYRGAGTVSGVTSCAAGTALIWQVPGAGTARIDATGTFSANMAVKSSGNGSTWGTNLQLLDRDALGGVGTSYGSSGFITVTNTTFVVPLFGDTYLCVYGSSYTSGAANISVTFSPDTRVVANVNIGSTQVSGGSVNVTGSSGNPFHEDGSDNMYVDLAYLNGVSFDTNNGSGSPGTQRVTISSDSTGQVRMAGGAVAGGGTQTVATVKAGSTLPAATDTATVVTQRDTATVVGGVANDTSTIGNAIETQPSVARAAPTAITAGRSEKLQVNAANGGQFSTLVGGTGLLMAGVLANDATAYDNGVEILPAIARATPTAVTAGRAEALQVNTVNGGQFAALVGGTGTLIADVLANDSTNLSNGLASLPGVARATPSALTAGRAEAVQIDTVSGGVLGTGSPTSNAAALTPVVVTANTAVNVKASAGNVYGFVCVNANASACYLQFYNTAGTPTCGTSVVHSVPLASTAVGAPTVVPPSPYALANFTTGIGVCMDTTQTGLTACTTANSCTIWIK